jgi:hypothetical protein
MNVRRNQRLSRSRLYPVIYRFVMKKLSGADGFVNPMGWRISAALASTMALLAVVLTERYHQPKPTSRPFSDPFSIWEMSPASSTSANQNPGSPRLDRLIRYCSSLVRPDRSFVVFAHGTPV